jgi:hypothetical protein
VLLPAPLGPRKPKISPRPTAKVRLRTAGRFAPGYEKSKDFVSMIGAVDTLAAFWDPRPWSVSMSVRIAGAFNRGSLRQTSDGQQKHPLIPPKLLRQARDLEFASFFFARDRVLLGLHPEPHLD